jgi:hypothetical protein
MQVLLQPGALRRHAHVPARLSIFRDDAKKRLMPVMHELKQKHVDTCFQQISIAIVQYGIDDDAGMLIHITRHALSQIHGAEHNGRSDFQGALQLSPLEAPAAMAEAIAGFVSTVESSDDETHHRHSQARPHSHQSIVGHW